MSRDLAFDREGALDLALDQFWRHGFHGTSMRDLADRSGLSLSSLYHSFGDKRSLFLAVLDRYGTQHLHARLDRLKRDLPPREAIQALFMAVASESAMDRERLGCFLVNTALEMSPHDPDIETRVRKKLAVIRTFLKGRLEAAETAGDLRPGQNLEARASHLLSVLLGLRVLARANPDRPTLEAIVGEALGGLGTPTTPRRRTR